ncbi:MAG: hypothetical protein HXX18_06540 [Bacteroidetes bacterium]|nr:hypothetical protein [Bacteroidota bacterium]
MNKKKVIISYHNLTAEVLDAFKEKYPYGYSDYITKITKPNNDVIYVVPLDTDDAAYLVKVDVKVDTKMSEEDFDKLLFRGVSGAVDKVADSEGGDAEHEDLGTDHVDAISEEMDDSE